MRAIPLLAAAVAAALLSCAPGAPAVVSDRAERGLSDGVRQATTRLYMPSQAYGSVPSRDPASLTLWMYSIAVFGRDGFVADERSFDSGNRLTSLVVYERDADGRPSGSASRSPSGALEQRLVYRYDDAGRRYRREYYDADGGLTGFIEDRYDDRGRVAGRRTETYYSDGEIRSTETAFAYGPSGELLDETYLDPDSGRVLLRVSHAYEDGRRARSYHYQAGSWLEGVEFYYYDANGDLSRQASYQVPDDGASYDAVAREDDMPPGSFSSETRYEYRYFDDGGRP